jgi:uncharacterized membrane protein YebE (DUF533 family)
MITAHRQQPHQFEVRFASLFRVGRAVAFPCDPNGIVDLGRMSEQARNSYVAACAMVGKEYATPQIVLSDLQ